MKNSIKILFSIAIIIAGLGISSSINAQVVINEVYGGGGNNGAPLNADFIELYNNSGTAVNLTGYTLWYASATTVTGFNSSVVLTGTIQPRGFYLVQVSNTGNNGAALPTPDDTATFGIAATTGNVLLTQATLTAPFGCATATANTVDRVTYGTGNDFICSETAAAPAGSNTTSVTRNSPGLDTNNNSADFTAIAPTPQNSLAPTASGGTISGRIHSARGRGLTRIVVMLSGGTLEEPLYATTNQFGYYRFEDIPVGESYVLSIFAKRYNFSPSSKVVSLDSSLTDVNFVSDSFRDKSEISPKSKLNFR